MTDLSWYSELQQKEPRHQMQLFYFITRATRGLTITEIEQRVLYMLNQGHNPNEPNIVYEIICNRRDLSPLISLLFSHPQHHAACSRRNQNGQTLLHLAVLDKNVCAVKALLACNKILIDQEDDQKQTPLSCARHQASFLQTSGHDELLHIISMLEHAAIEVAEEMPVR